MSRQPTIPPAPAIHRVIDPDRSAFPATAAAFLASLRGPTLIVVPGRDSSRSRGLSTLLHGNEPSGLIGLHRWLCSDAIPAVNLVCFLGAVDAARAAPGFANRMLPGKRDLNRCFKPPFDIDEEGRVAREFLDVIAEFELESLVDLHNNTGHNPPYGVLTHVDPERLNLVSMFTQRSVVSSLRLGTLTEATEDFPSVTVECGRSGDPIANEVAAAGIIRYAAADRVTSDFGEMLIHEAHIQVRLAPGLRVVFSDEPDPDAAVTFMDHVEGYNFARVPAGTRLGWIRPETPWPLAAIDDHGNELSHERFAVASGEIRTTVPMTPIMMTTDSRVAGDDCLCYLVNERRG